MRFWLVAFITQFVFLVAAQAQSFPGDAPVTFSFRESLKDKVVREPGTLVSDESYLVGTERSVTITGSAPLVGYDIAEIDEFTSYSIIVGDFDSGQITNGQLNDDELYEPGVSTKVEVPILAFTYDGDEVPIGRIKLEWTRLDVSFSVQYDNVNQSLTEIDDVITADFYRERDETIDAEDLTAAFGFGPFGYELRTVYIVGTAQTSFDERVPDILSDVSIFGAIDYVPPQVSISFPPPNEETPLPAVTISGSVQDFREIKVGNSTQVFPGEVAKVEVQVGPPLSPGDFVEATLTGTGWQLDNAPLVPGENRITARATDVHGNVTTTPNRKITYAVKGDITIDAEAVGFPAGASGAAGTVKGPLLGTRAVTANIGGGVATAVVKNIDAGQQFTVTATPAPGAVFNGWTATLDGAPHFTSVDEKLLFEAKPLLLLRAEFVPNPFEPVLGTYHGLVSGENAPERGTFKVSVGKTGAFTGKIIAGALTLPLKGKILGSGRWEGVLKKGNTDYNVAFDINVTGVGDRVLNGNFAGAGLTSTIQADLNDWRKARGSDPGKLATEYAAAYNVLLNPPADPSTSVPQGTGYAKVTIKPTGAVTFAGKLGDGTVVKGGSTLVQRVSGPVFFPLFLSLEKKAGNLSGNVNYSAQPSSDLFANLAWSEPATKKVEPRAFSGELTLSGARYTPPEKGALAMLTATNGNGFVELTLPIYTIPANPPAQFQQPSATVLIDPKNHAVTATSPDLQSLAFKMKITPKTGLFSGTFKDPDLGKTIPFTGAIVQKPNGGQGLGGGVFARGNRAGAVHFGPPPPP